MSEVMSAKPSKSTCCQPRGPFAERLGALPRPGQLGDEGRGPFRRDQRRGPRAQRRLELADRREHVVPHRAERDPLGVPDDVLQALHQRREPGLDVELLVAGARGEVAELGGDREDLDVQARAGEVSGV